jgi:hypothetical protein
VVSSLLAFQQRCGAGEEHGVPSLHRRAAQLNRQVRLARARRAEEQHILRLGDETPRGQADECGWGGGSGSNRGAGALLPPTRPQNSRGLGFDRPKPSS